MRKKIAILGKGTAGSLALAHFSRYSSNCDIDWYFDPSAPVQAVGEGSTLTLPKALYNTLAFTYDDLRKVNGTQKTGIYKENWGTTNKSFFHDFVPPTSAMHFNAIELQNYIQEHAETRLKDRVNIIAESVDYKNVDANYVLNATGKPKDFSDFHISEYIPVNAAYVTQCYWDGPKFDYTLCIVGKYGWVFGIPLQNRCSIGYMYNKDINTEEEVAEDVKEIFEKYGLTPSDNTNSLQFKNYYRKENYEDKGRLVHSGNSSFFLEPLEATSLGLMDKIQRAAWDIWSGSARPAMANEDYLNEINEIEAMIMLHYAAGSPFKTEFWDFAQERGIKKLESVAGNPRLLKMWETIKGYNNLYEARDLAIDSVPEFGSWWLGSFIQNISGLGMEDVMGSIFKQEDN